MRSIKNIKKFQRKFRIFFKIFGDFWKNWDASNKSKNLIVSSKSLSLTRWHERLKCHDRWSNLEGTKNDLEKLERTVKAESPRLSLSNMIRLPDYIEKFRSNFRSWIRAISIQEADGRSRARLCIPRTSQAKWIES